MSPEEYSYSFLLWPKIITATSTEQRTESSWAFLNRPPLRLRKVLRWRFSTLFYQEQTTLAVAGTIREIAGGVELAREAGLVGIAHNEMGPLTYTDRFLSSLIALISIFRLPILAIVVVCVNKQ